MGNLEKACLPATDPEERKKLLSFVVCGGGPTGVEFASELFDMVNEDVLDCEWQARLGLDLAGNLPILSFADFSELRDYASDMPKILRDQISVHIIQSRDHILNTYSETISKYAEVSAHEVFL